MRLLSRLTLTSFRPLTSLVVVGMSFATMACGDDSEATRTINSLSDAGPDASIDASTESDEDAGTSTPTRATTREPSSSTDAATKEPRSSAPDDAGKRPETTESPETSQPAETSEPPEATGAADSSTGDESDSTGDAGDTSEPPLPASCGNGEVDGDEMCCRTVGINTALEARFTAAELLLNGDLGCAPPQASQENNVSYELCGGECGTGVGCAVSASNVELTYDPSAKRFNGIADVVIEGSVVLSLAILNQTVSCDTAHVLFEEVTFTGDLVTEVGQEQTTVDVRNLESQVGVPVVTGCAQGNVISAAFLLMQAPIETAVSEAVEQALEGTIAQPVECPY